MSSSLSKHGGDTATYGVIVDAKRYICPVCGLVFFCKEDPDQGCCSGDHAEIYLAWSESDSRVPLSQFVTYWRDTFRPSKAPSIWKAN